MTNTVLIAPDKFKGSLTAVRAAAHIANGLRRVHPDLEFREVPVADGGDGTLDAAVAAGFRRIPVTVSGPTGQPVSAAYAERDGTAVIELSQASGLAALPGGTLRPLHTTSYGTGELVRAALDAGCATVVLGLGGSASTDGGAGLLQALGVQLLDTHGEDIGQGGGALPRLAGIDTTGLHPAVGTAEFVVAGDVDNPLLGRQGAAAVYGPQKGASPAQVKQLEQGLAHFAETVRRVPGAQPDAARRKGAGAAGGVGFAAMAVLGATVRPGIDYLLELTGFHRKLADASLVITGEGSLDEQSLRGKAPTGVAAHSKAAGVAVVAVAGRCTLNRDALRSAGFAAAWTLADIEPDPQKCIANAGPLLETLAAERIAVSDLFTDAVPRK